MPFTPDSELDLLFPAEMIPPYLKNGLPADLHLRPLALTDYYRGHLSVLSVLSVVNDLGFDAYTAHFNAMRVPSASHPPSYFTIVFVHKPTDSILAVGTVFLERKFLRGFGTVGHIEDIAVDKKSQGQKLGWRIIKALTDISEKQGCYKTILNCSDANIPFYEKCGYKKKENEMAKYANEPPATPPQKL